MSRVASIGNRDASIKIESSIVGRQVARAISAMMIVATAAVTQLGSASIMDMMMIALALGVIAIALYIVASRVIACDMKNWIERAADILRYESR